MRFSHFLNVLCYEDDPFIPAAFNKLVGAFYYHTISFSSSVPLPLNLVLKMSTTPSHDELLVRPETDCIPDDV